MKNKIIASLLCAAAVLGLAGCSSQPEETTSAATEQTTTSSETTKATTEETAANAGFDTTDFLSSYPSFEVTSEDLAGGVWADEISYTEAGQNASPALSWAPVEGATVYVIYMVDTSGQYWLHWKSDAVTETELPRGWAPESDYIGPYPPSGDTHVYEIYVVALRAPVERLKGAFNSLNPNFEAFLEGLDTDAEGNTGNIVAYGHISGEFTSIAF